MLHEHNLIPLTVCYSVCSMTLWVGHLSKLVAEDDLSDSFGEQGQVNTIDLIPPRGCAFVCMNRRQDAYRVLNKLHKHKIHGKPITVRTENVRRLVDLQDGLSPLKL